MKKLLIIALVLVLLAAVFFALTLLFPGGLLQGDAEPADTDPPATPKPTAKPAPTETPNPDTTVTLLVYMIGSDLESEGGCASLDLEEICTAELSDQVQVVIQTGGCSWWGNDAVTGGWVERFVVDDHALRRVDSVGSCRYVSMVDPDTLSDFLAWGTEAYPADRTGVIFWNHGGGSVMGFGYDPYDEYRMLELDEIGDAFRDAGVSVEFVGFDACLMGTLETACALSGCADYLLASEETEPGTGWYYTNWLELLAEDPNVSMRTLGGQIIDDYVHGPDVSRWDDLTLGLFDLSKAEDVYRQMSAYLSDARTLLLDGGFRTLAGARDTIRSYGDDGYDQVDILAYLRAAGAPSRSLERALQSMTVYYQGNLPSSNGLAMYYPYAYPYYYSDMHRMMERIGMDDADYLGYFSDFVSILSGGQAMGSQNSGSFLSSIEQLTGTPSVGVSPEEPVDLSEESWYNDDAAQNAVDLSALFTAAGELYLDERDEGFVLDLTPEQWGAISNVEMELYIDDGEGFLFFGRDTRIFYNDDGDMIADFDFCWVHVNGHVVPFFILEDITDGDYWQATGVIPATLNFGTPQEQDINIYVRWNSENEYGVILGYAAYEEFSGIMTVPVRNYLQLQPGDTLRFFCDYYTYDGDFDATYFIGDILTVPEDGLDMGYYELDYDIDLAIGFRLTDLYLNQYWTEVLYYYGS